MLPGSGCSLYPILDSLRPLNAESATGPISVRSQAQASAFGRSGLNVKGSKSTPNPWGAARRRKTGLPGYRPFIAVAPIISKATPGLTFRDFEQAVPTAAVCR